LWYLRFSSFSEKTTVNTPLHLTNESAKELSAATKVSKEVNKTVKIAVIAAENDSPEFIKQAQEFQKWLHSEGFQFSEYKFFKQLDHFDSVEQLAATESELFKYVSNFIRSSGIYNIDSKLGKLSL